MEEPTPSQMQSVEVQSVIRNTEEDTGKSEHSALNQSLIQNEITELELEILDLNLTLDLN